MTLEEQIREVENSYHSRKKKEAEMSEMIWKGYSEKVQKLIEIVSKEFRKVLGEIGPINSPNEYNPGKSEILEFHIIYKPPYSENDRGAFCIQIDKFKFSDGRIFENRDGKCPHCYIDEILGFLGKNDKPFALGNKINSKIADFMKNYYISYISEPENCCEHK